MTETLLHITIPYVTLTALGVKPKKAFIASLISLLPDIDALLRIHRSQTHSLPILLAATIPLILLTQETKIKEYVIPATIALIIHLFLDVFTAPTPILWPLYNQSIWITIELNLQITQNPIPSTKPTINIQATQTTFQQTSSLEAPIITSQGLIITLILLTPTIIQTIKTKLTKTSHHTTN